MFTIEQVAQGVWAAVVTPGSGAVGNASIIDLGDFTVIVDTFSLPEAAKGLRMQAEQLTAKPVKYIINTHYHGDHHYGNQEFADCIIISTEQTREVLTSNAPPELKVWLESLQKQITALQEDWEVAAEQRLKEDLGYEIAEKEALLKAAPGIRRVTAGVTFQDTMDIHGSARSIQLLTYGGGHTCSDAMVYIADVQVLIAGDLGLNQSHPAMLHGFPEAWAGILERIGQDIDFKVLIPGHGGVAGPECLQEMLSYLKAIQSYAAAAVQSGTSADDWLAGGIPAPFHEWTFSHVFSWNFRWLYNQYSRN
ncbi:MBL fold metallo-hydrolase [Paenibacillus sp. MMS20-IR301]|uniref:MBL fold metallo-hydrolase n=1 Tax=Paenibacillus sp. MMS20-IR301 TaxID=2895946 RepID=UPI0028E5C888|nr:MBL fold metallo-hydrolase [Paenibacillus sp. MMS20-IR301]WNS44623.1 MBL fold metallo-hydrolase [Paenibacillus sp. MMS20-IR301]